MRLYTVSFADGYEWSQEAESPEQAVENAIAWWRVRHAPTLPSFQVTEHE